MKKFSFLLVFLLLFLFAALPLQANDIQDLKEMIDESKGILKQINNDSIIKIILLYSIIFIGLAVTVLQAINKNNIQTINIMIIILGTVITTVSTINTTIIKYDMQDVEITKMKITKNVKAMERALRSYKDKENIEIVSGIINEYYQQNSTLYEEYLGKKWGKTEIKKASFFPKVYAQSEKPSWIASANDDEKYWYMVGRDESNNYDDALKNADADGRNKFRELFLKTITNDVSSVIAQDIAKNMASKAVIEDQYFEIDNGHVIVYILLRYSKSSINSTINSFQLKNKLIQFDASKVKDSLKLLKRNDLY